MKINKLYRCNWHIIGYFVLQIRDLAAKLKSILALVHSCSLYTPFLQTIFWFNLSNLKSMGSNLKFLIYYSLHNQPRNLAQSLCTSFTKKLCLCGLSQIRTKGESTSPLNQDFVYIDLRLLLFKFLVRLPLTWKKIIQSHCKPFDLR